MTRGLPKALEEDIPSIDDFQGVVEKLRKELDAARRIDMPDMGEGK